MNPANFRATVRERLASAASRSAPDQSSAEAAWLVLEAANDLGDHAAVEACRRVIDANLSGTHATESDVQLVLNYFK